MIMTYSFLVREGLLTQSIKISELMLGEALKPLSSNLLLTILGELKL